MRMHSILPWPPITQQPLRKQEKAKRAKAAEQTLDVFGEGSLRVPPPPRENEGGDPRGENIDIVV